MSDSSVSDDPGGPGGGQEAADTTWSSIESMPSWAGLPAEQYALSTGGLLSAPSSGQVAGAVRSPPVLTPGAAAQQPAHWPSLQGPDLPLAKLQLQFKQLHQEQARQAQLHQEQLRQQQQQAERQEQMMVMMQNLMTRMNAAPAAPQPGRVEVRSVTPPPPAVQPGPAVATQVHNPLTPPRAPGSEGAPAHHPPAPNQIPTLSQPPPQCPVASWVQRSVLDGQVALAPGESAMLPQPGTGRAVPPVLGREDTFQIPISWIPAIHQRDNQRRRPQYMQPV